MEINRKKKLLYLSDYCNAKTGFAKVARVILTYLYNTNKFDIIGYCAGLNWSNPELNKTPWKNYGALPDNPQEIEQLNRDPNLARAASYGAYNLDKIVLQEKPDIFLAVQDIWGIDFSVEKYWFNKINSVLWTTLDSLPLLPNAVSIAPKVKNYWIWSNFAVKEMHKLGHNHVKLMHGPIYDDDFYRLSDYKRNELRQKYNITKDTFIIGFVFRNQLRKSVPNLLEGYKIWKKENPTIKSALLLHTSWNEGWQIHKLADEYKVDKNEILTTFICRACKEYEIKKFTKHEEDCRFCGNKNPQITTNVGLGVDENQLNEIYNLMDVYCHPFTSGGQEIPILEAKLTELITLITNYSCGEELCQDGSGSISLDYAEYREWGTEFIKASTYPSSIAKQIDKIYKMSLEDRRKIGKISREWTIKNYSIKNIGKQIENFLDSCEITNFDFSQPQIELKNPQAQILNIEDNKTWIKTLYKEILKMEVQENDTGLAYWMEALNKGMKRQEVENYFRGVAMQENQKNNQSKQIPFEEILIKNNKKNLLLVAKESIGDLILITSLLKNWRENYPINEWNIYFACDPQYIEIFDGISEIDKVIPYQPFMESEIMMTGQGKNKGYFDAYCNICLATQKYLNYLTNNNIGIKLNE